MFDRVTVGTDCFKIGGFVILAVAVFMMNIKSLRARLSTSFTLKIVCASDGESKPLCFIFCPGPGPVEQAGTLARAKASFAGLKFTPACDDFTTYQARAALKTGQRAIRPLLQVKPVYSIVFTTGWADVVNPRSLESAAFRAENLAFSTVAVMALETSVADRAHIHAGYL